MRIIIYTRNNCVQCHATKKAMESRGLDFEMVNVDLQPDRLIACALKAFASYRSWSQGKPVGQDFART